MLKIPETEFGKDSIFTFNNLNDEKGLQTQNQKMTLQDYIQLKNLQRKLQTQASNYLKGITPAVSEKKQIQLNTLVYQIKQFIKGVIGGGSLFKKFNMMLDNLYTIFMNQITILHNSRVQKEKVHQDMRLSQFRFTNQKITDYLKNCEKQTNSIDQKLQRLKKNKEMFRKQREKTLIENQKMKKSKILEDKMLQDQEQAQPVQKIDINKLFANEPQKLKQSRMFLNPNTIRKSQKG